MRWTGSSARSRRSSRSRFQSSQTLTCQRVPAPRSARPPGRSRCSGTWPAPAGTSPRRAALSRRCWPSAAAVPTIMLTPTSAATPTEVSGRRPGKHSSREHNHSTTRSCSICKSRPWPPSLRITASTQRSCIPGRSTSGITDSRTWRANKTGEPTHPECPAPAESRRWCVRGPACFTCRCRRPAGRRLAPTAACRRPSAACPARPTRRSRRARRRSARSRSAPPPSRRRPSRRTP